MKILQPVVEDPAFPKAGAEHRYLRKLASCPSAGAHQSTPDVAAAAVAVAVAACTVKGRSQLVKAQQCC